MADLSCSLKSIDPLGLLSRSADCDSAEIKGFFGFARRRPHSRRVSHADGVSTWISTLDNLIVKRGAGDKLLYAAREDFRDAHSARANSDSSPSDLAGAGGADRLGTKSPNQNAALPLHHLVCGECRYRTLFGHDAAGYHDHPVQVPVMSRSTHA